MVVAALGLGADVTLTIKVRGTSSQPIVSEYMCPEHGRFDVTVARDANGDPPTEHPCPGVWGADECGRASQWVISAPIGRVKLGEVSQGKSAEKPHELALDTRELGEGMPLNEWKKKRAKLWNEQRYKQFKESL